jgi:hypothetical protein
VLVRVVAGVDNVEGSAYHLLPLPKWQLMCHDPPHMREPLCLPHHSVEMMRKSIEEISGPDHIIERIHHKVDICIYWKIIIEVLHNLMCGWMISMIIKSLGLGTNNDDPLIYAHTIEKKQVSIHVA